MADKKLTVTTDAGTFTRRTARTYSHLVVVKGERAELLNAERLRNIATDLKHAATYEKAQATGICDTDRPVGTIGGNADRQSTAKFRAEGLFAQWALEARARAERRATPIDADLGDTFGILGWCGRLDLAVKLAATEAASRYREVRIYALDGTRVR